MYLLDASAIITPFHTSQLGALSVALRSDSIEETRQRLESWYERGFRSGDLVLAREVYEELTTIKKGKPPRPEQVLLKRLWEAREIKVLEPNQEFFQVLTEIHLFVKSHFEPHQAEAFLKEGEADPILLALARVYGAKVITEERFSIPQSDGSSGLIMGKPRLPFIGSAFGVQCLSLLQILLSMRLNEGEQFGGQTQEVGGR